MALYIESDRQQPVDIEFRALTFRVASKTEPDGVFDILRGLDGKCRSGRLLALMGPSGSGKTTLVRSIPFQTLVTYCDFPSSTSWPETFTEDVWKAKSWSTELK